MGKLRSWILLFLSMTGLGVWAISAPSITSCTRPSSTSVSLAWTSVSDASYYVVRRSYTSSVGSSSSIATPSGTSYTDSTAGADTCYYWVEAWDTSGASARSGMATASSGSSGSSSGAFTISATKGTSTSGCTITWTAQSGATGYRVVRGTTSNMDNASILVETVTGTSYTDTTGTAGKTYYYWIVAKKSSGYVTSSYATGYKASSSSGSSDSGSSTDTNTYTVEFNANGGTGTMANESFVYGTAKALTICTFTRTGYTFVGWATSASATTSTYDDGQSVSNLTSTSGGTVTLYAVWQANTYTVKFNANGGAGTMANLAMTYGTAKALTANAFQRANYKFIGWATSASATAAAYTDTQSVKNLTATPDGTVTLYAVWKLVLEVTSVTARARYPWNGLVDIDVTFSASGLSTVTFTVKDTDGGTNLNARTFYLGNPEKGVQTLEVQPGTHRFVWDAAADLGAVDRIPFAVTATVTEKNFQVNVTGGTGSGSYVQGASVPVVAAAKTGYTFASWTGTTADVGQLASATDSSTTTTIPSHDLAYTATYTPNTYTVKFNANGGTGTMAVESFTYDTAKALTSNAFTRTGWTFLGWAESAKAITPQYTDQQSIKNLMTSGSKSLYAVWSWASPGVQLWKNGPYWSECNVGATKPEEAGYYFWWGDTVGYKALGGTWSPSFTGSSTYNHYAGVTWVSSDGTKMDSSPFCTNTCPTFAKDNATLLSLGYIDSTGNLTMAHDAAVSLLGALWRMPTSEDFEELVSNCTLDILTTNDMRCLVVQGKGDYISKKIFFPFVGLGYGSELSGPYYESSNANKSYRGLGCYSTSTPDSKVTSSCAFRGQDVSDFRIFGGTYSQYRSSGLTIRPVRAK